MRTEQQINDIKKHFSRPYYINYLDQSDIDHLLEIYNSAQKLNRSLVYKNTGPITLDINPYKDDIIVKKLLTRIEQEIGSFEITAGFFFKTNIPHIIHNDDTYELPNNVYKAITIPLALEGHHRGVYPKLCFFEQYYFHGPTKFFKGEEKILSFYNQPLYSYDQVDNLVENNMEFDRNLLAHLKPKWLEGLSLADCIDWIPNRMIIFDSVQLHCASDFRQLGFINKTAISIFTKKI